MSTTPKKMLLALAGAVLLGCGMEPAMAVVTTLTWHRGGEADVGAVVGNTLPGMNDNIGSPSYKVEDSSGNNQYIVGGQTGSITWTNDVPAASELTLGASTLAYDYADNGGGLLYRTASQLATTLNNNVGMECWVKASVASANNLIAHNGSISSGAGVADGFGFIQAGTTYMGHLAGYTVVGSTPVSTSEWTHLALVVDAGVTTFYVNGVANGTPVGVPIAPTGVFCLGASPYDPGGSGFFYGNVDEVRVFSFEPGMFNVSDLNYAIPEPAALSLLGLALLGLWRRRI